MNLWKFIQKCIKGNIANERTHTQYTATPVSESEYVAAEEFYRWYAGPEQLPWPTSIWIEEDNLRKAFLAGKEAALSTWAVGNVTLPDGTTFKLAVCGNKVRIRKAGWWPFEGSLTPHKDSDFVVTIDCAYGTESTHEVVL